MVKIKAQMDRELISIRVDDIPLIYAMLEQLGVRSAIDKVIKVHGHWEGPSVGRLTSLWICYILSECDHRLSAVEPWAEQRLPLLQGIVGNRTLSSKDFADDKLALILDYLSEEEDWSKIEESVNKTGLGIYRLKTPSSLPTFRLDSAPMQSHGSVAEGGLLQYGYSKHHNGNLGQFKIQLCSLDNEVNHFAYPISHLTVSGEQADDGLYLPLIKEVRGQLLQQEGYEQGNLYVGDGKMGSISVRATISLNKDYYLLPLSKVQLSDDQRLAYIESVGEDTYQQVVKIEQSGQDSAKQKVVARGFEQVIEQSYDFADSSIQQWQERLIFVQSDYYAHQQQQKLDKQLEKTTQQLLNLTQARQGRKVLTTLKEVQESVNNILKDNGLKDLLVVNIEQTTHTKSVRAYGTKPAREEVSYTFELSVHRQEQQIERRKKLMGWQVYVTNAPSDLLTFEQCVWKYRYQSNIERQFDNIRNKVVKLLPVFLTKDNRIVGLVNLLLLALKACCVVEYKVAKALKEQQKELGDIYEGNPKRTSPRPSAKRLFRAFDGISIAVVFVNKHIQYALMSNLEPVQKNILQLLGLECDLYTNLVHHIQLSFSNSVLIET